MTMIMEEYIGDGVYASYDGYHIVLKTLGSLGPSNKIHLEPPVMQRLKEYEGKIAEHQKKVRESQQNFLTSQEDGNDQQ